MGALAPGSSVTWGDVLRHVVAIDAFVVLSGSVLTSYVGMGGLLKYVPDYIMSYTYTDVYP